MSTRIPVYVHATDPLSRAGLTAELRSQPDLRLVGEDDVDANTVAIVAADSLAEESLGVLRRLNGLGCHQIILVVDELTDGALLAAIESGVCTMIRRHEVTPESLARLVVKTASGEGALPPDVLGRVLKQVARLQRNVLAPMGLSAMGFSAREIDVLKLVAIGMDTNEIAKKLTYSERTIKNVLHDITNRYQLKNRTHAVAFAMREGLI